MISKSEAVQLFQYYGLEGLPTRLVTSKDDLITLFSNEFRKVALVNIRACSEAEHKNLPRLICAHPSEAINWLAVNSVYSSFAVQPYDDLLFSFELVITNKQVFVELVPGIWEMDSLFSPAIFQYCPNQSHINMSIPLEPQPAKFWNVISRQAEQESRFVEDWQLTETATWIKNHFSVLSQLANQVQMPLGIKAHYSRNFGISPQNIHTNNVVMPDIKQPSGAPYGTPIITDALEEVPDGNKVILLASIAREESNLLDGLIDKLHKAGTKSVYLKSGMLSHLAITLREHGFKVRRA